MTHKVGNSLIPVFPSCCPVDESRNLGGNLCLLAGHSPPSFVSNDALHAS